MNILVTGSKGFVGKNFLQRFKNTKSINIYEFHRKTSFNFLENNIKYIDLIFHFAGEVRPKSTNKSFNTSNVKLTSKIISLIEKNKLSIPIIMTSSIHAEFPKNSYGQSKRDSEILLENYHKKNNVSVKIYRLTHLFGEGCKPNYNSVISTWIYNIIHNKKITVYDRDIKMSYIYIQDLIDELLILIKNYNTNDKNFKYLKLKCIYDTTLGEVLDFLNEFKLLDLKNIEINKFNSFKRKLLTTYLNYFNLSKKETQDVN